MAGDGRVLRVGDELSIKFKLRRVTNPLLAELSLSFSVRDTRIDAHDEESRLVVADLRARPAAKAT